MTGAIKFIGNPYPNGHTIEMFRWFAIEEPDGSITLQFRLVTEDYAKSAPTSNDDSSDWTSAAVWENYAQCILSSVDWGNSGIKIANSSYDFTPDIFNDLTLYADSLNNSENDIQTHTFGIYLLGHDHCANHAISFKMNDNESFNIDWSGRIALSYAGDDEYAYGFEANISNAKFEGIIPRNHVPSFIFGDSK